MKLLKLIALGVAINAARKAMSRKSSVQPADTADVTPAQPSSRYDRTAGRNRATARAKAHR